MAGLLGTLLTGVFALRVLNPAGADGLITGRIGQLWIQIQAAGFTILWVGVVPGVNYVGGRVDACDLLPI